MTSPTKKLKPKTKKNFFIADLPILSTLWRLAGFGDFREKNTEMHVALHRNFTAPVRVMDLVKMSKDTASVLVCTQKKIFWLGGAVFCEWRHKWRTFRPPWLTLSGPGRQPLDQWFPTFFISRPHLKIWHKPSAAAINCNSKSVTITTDKKKTHHFTCYVQCIYIHMHN